MAILIDEQLQRGWERGIDDGWPLVGSRVDDSRPVGRRRRRHAEPRRAGPSLAAVKLVGRVCSYINPRSARVDSAKRNPRRGDKPDILQVIVHAVKGGE